MAWYAALAAGAAAAALGKTLVYAAALGPTDFGVVTLAMLLVALGAYPATFGLQDGLARQVPLLRGRGEPTGAVRGSALLAATLGAVGVGLLITLGVLVAGMSEATDLWWAGPFLAASVAFNMTQTDLQAREHSVAQAALLLAKSAVPMLAVLTAGAGWSAGHILGLETGVLLVLTATSLYWRAGDLQWAIRRAIVLDLSRIGLPFTGSSFAHNLAINLDRWAVQAVWGVAALGTYAFALQAVAAGLVVLNITQMYLTPRWLRAWAAERDVAALLSRAWRRLIWTGSAGVLGGVAGLALAPTLVGTWWPEYAEALPLLPWVVAGALAVALGFFDVLFLAAGAGPRLIRVHLVAGLCTAVALAVLVWAAAPLVWFAVVFAAGRLTTLTLGWVNGRAAVMQTSRVGWQG